MAFPPFRMGALRSLRGTQKRACHHWHVPRVTAMRPDVDRNRDPDVLNEHDCVAGEKIRLREVELPGLTEKEIAVQIENGVLSPTRCTRKTSSERDRRTAAHELVTSHTFSRASSHVQPCLATRSAVPRHTFDE